MPSVIRAMPLRAIRVVEQTERLGEIDVARHPRLLPEDHGVHTMLRRVVHVDRRLQLRFRCLELAEEIQRHPEYDMRLEHEAAVAECGHEPQNLFAEISRRSQLTTDH